MTPSVPCVCSVMPRPWKEIAGCRTGVEARRAANVVGIDAAQRGHRLGSEVREEAPELVEAVDPFGDEVSIDEILVDDRARDRVEQRDVRARADRRCTSAYSASSMRSRVDHDEVRAAEERPA